MAGSRAAASVSLTIGVAFATLLVAGGILVGPAILDCKDQSQGLGACLRAKAERAGLLEEQPRAPSSAPVVTAKLQAPPLLAPEPQRPQGWLEANANEYEAPLSSGSVQLTPPIGTVGADGNLTARSMPPGTAEVSAAPGAIAASGKTLPAPDASARIALARPPGRLAAAGAVIARPDGAVVDLSAEPADIGATGTALPGTLETSAGVAVAAPTGRISLDGLGPPGTGASALADPLVTRGAAAITGSIAGAATQHGTVALEAEADIPEAIPAPLHIAPRAPLPAPKLARPKPPKAAAITPQPAKSGPKRVVKADPRYPNVLVLPPPPPIAGVNSSFATLEIR